VFTLMVPVLLSYTLTQIGLFVQQNISSMLPKGSLTAVHTAQRLMQMPVSIFAVAMAVAVYPTLNGQVARQEMGEFKKTFAFGLRNIFYVTVPCAVGLGVLSGQVVRLLYQRGNYTAENTALTAYTLAFFCIGLFAQGGVLMMNRVYYALQNTWTPVITGAGAMLLNIALNFILIGPLATGGLALAYSIANIVNLGAMLIIVRRRIGPIGGRDIAASFGKTAGASAVMGGVVYAVVQAFEAAGISAAAGGLLQTGAAIAAGCLVYFGISMLLKMEETELIMKAIKRIRR
jgi:putative peptidoglycan lipid II flippase